MNSRREEDDRVRRLLGLPDLATEPESSDHVDDDTLALLTDGGASGAELAAVRAHLVVCPPCRRLVGQVLGDAQAGRPEALPAQAGGWPRRASAVLAWAAACLLLAAAVAVWSWNRGRDTPRPRRQPVPGDAPLWAELLTAPVSWERGVARGDEPGRSALTLKIDSPRDGVAMVLGVSDGRWELLRGELAVKKGPANDYGPIDSRPGPVVYIVVLSDRLGRGELARTIRESLPGEARDLEAYFPAWRDDVRARLTRGGHRWVAIEPVRVEPAKPGPGEQGSEAGAASARNGPGITPP